MKIGIYNPYFNSFGGGERYVLTLAEHWSASHDVSILWDDPAILSQSEERFNLNLSKVKVIPNFFGSRNLFTKIIMSRQYDLLFILSDGSIPTSFAKFNILHFQVPFSRVLLPAWKSYRYQMIVCNSEFTKLHLDQNITIPMTVITPPVDVDQFTKGKKENVILSVGRFSSYYGAKKQDILIEVFKDCAKKKQFIGWKLVLAGSLLPNDISYFEKLQEKSQGARVEFHPNCSFSELKLLYASARIYWHGAGYGETNPEHMEHFGISTVEAMATETIPVVYGAGGQKDILEDGVSGYLWKTKDELIAKTLLAMNKSTRTNTIVRNAKKIASKFSKKHFTDEFDNLLNNICHQHS